MYLDVFSQISTIFLYYFISFTSISIWKARTTVALLHERQQPLVSFYFFVLFQIVWHFLRSNDLLSICRSVECNMQSMCRMRCMCFISIRCFFFRVTSRGCCGSFPVPCVAAEARQAKGQRQRWNTCTKSLPPRVHVDGCALCNTTFQCHPNELK